MAANLPRCMDVGRVCYSHPDQAICATAAGICWYGVLELYDGESGKGGRNRFDITHGCPSGDDLCYPESALIGDYLNTKKVWKALRVPAAVKNFSVISWDVNRAFETTNDEFISTQPQVLYLLDNNIDVLFYQGNLDLACNTAGNLKWIMGMEWKGQMAFNAQGMRYWKGSEGKEVGWFKEVEIEMGPELKKTRFAFVTHNGAGHMVPMDRPVQALDMVEKWLNKESFAQEG
jgi:cathepsin A (carboxypeptidase C)